MCEEVNPIEESKDRKPNPYYVEKIDLPLEDDYSEESDANSVCDDEPDILWQDDYLEEPDIDSISNEEK